MRTRHESRPGLEWLANAVKVSNFRGSLQTTGEIYFGIDKLPQLLILEVSNER